MDARPVRRYRIPRYPTRLRVLAKPELLARHVPPAWRKCAEVAGAAALLCAASGPMGCGTAPSPRDLARTTRAAPAAPAAGAIVAPIFEHGGGFAASGCIVVAPPVFLSEEEALEVIKTELAKSGVVLSRDRVMVRDVKIVRHKEDRSAAGAMQFTELRDSALPVELDAVDPKRSVAVEYVSFEDSLLLIEPYAGDSVMGFYMRHAAQLLSDQVRQKGPRMSLGVFYDPVGALMVARKEKDRKRAEAEAERRAKARSRELLRAQVKDFVDWLKAQGAI